MNDLKKQKAARWLVIAIAALIVFGQSVTDDNGGITPDGARYLGVAEYLLDGKTMWVPNDGRAPAGHEFFSTWPVGYPLLIACLAFVAPIGTFWAAKLVNVLFLALVITASHKRYGNNGLLASLILTCANMLALTSLALSDSLFVCLLILLTLAISTALEPKNGVQTRTLIQLLLLLIGTMFTRYIGVVVMPAMALIGALLYSRGRRADAVKILSVSAVAGLFFVAYMWMNIATTGYPTGIPRHAPVDSCSEIFSAFFVSLAGGLALPLASWNTTSLIDNVVWIVCALAVVFVGWRVVKGHSRAVERRYSDTLLVLATLSGTYLMAILALRHVTHFDSIDYRLIAPGILPLMFGAVLYGLERFPLARISIMAFVITAYCLSVVSRAWSAVQHNAGRSYYEATTSRRSYYANVPDSSIIIQPSYHVHYLRPSVHVVFPRRQPYDIESETIASFLGSLDWRRRIFLDTRHINASSAGYHESVVRWIHTFPSDTLIEVSRSDIER